MIHKTAIVEDKYGIGRWTSVWHYTIIRHDVSIGDNCNIGSNVFIDENVRIGNNCKIQNYACIYNGVTIGTGVLIGPHVCFTNDKYPKALNKNGLKKGKDDWNLLPTLVEDGASIGAGSVILCGIKIGENAMVGAGSVVTKDVLANCFVCGNPAKIIRRDNERRKSSGRS